MQTLTAPLFMPTMPTNMTFFAGLRNEFIEDVNRYLESAPHDCSEGESVEILTRIFEYIRENADACAVLLSEKGDIIFQKQVMMITHKQFVADMTSGENNVPGRCRVPLCICCHRQRRNRPKMAGRRNEKTRKGIGGNDTDHNSKRHAGFVDQYLTRMRQASSCGVLLQSYIIVK